MNLSSYPSIHNLGHREIASILDGPVVVQEKVDGSQFTFGLVPKLDANGLTDGYALRFRSKGAIINPDDPTNCPKQFRLAVEWILQSASELTPGYVYRGEAVTTPKHNTLKYDRAAAGGIVLFDIENGPGTANYLSPANVRNEAGILGIDVVPTYYEGTLTGFNGVDPYLEMTSILGGKVEGVVVKNYDRFGPDHKPLMAKVVRPEFREMHTKDWKLRNPNRADVVATIVDQLRANGARWHKAVQHLRDAGKLQEAVQDIGPLLKELNQDIQKEEADRIRDVLFNHFWKDISRGASRGFAEWYKDYLQTPPQLYVGTSTPVPDYVENPDVPDDDVPAWFPEPGFPPPTEDARYDRDAQILDGTEPPAEEVLCPGLAQNVGTPATDADNPCFPPEVEANIDGIRSGLEDLAAGRTRPWRDIRPEFAAPESPVVENQETG